MTTTESLENMDVRIYFAHSVLDYGNIEFENNCLSKIRELYPGCEITNPRDIILADKDKKIVGYAAFMVQMKKYYFPAIDKCDIIVAFKYSKTGNYTPGVIKEIEYARKKGKKVIEL